MGLTCTVANWFRVSNPQVLRQYLERFIRARESQGFGRKNTDGVCLNDVQLMEQDARFRIVAYYMEESAGFGWTNDAGDEDSVAWWIQENLLEGEVYRETYVNIHPASLSFGVDVSTHDGKSWSTYTDALHKTAAEALGIESSLLADF